MVMPRLPAGHRPTAAELEEWADQIDSLTAPGFTSYTPTWTGSGSNPAIGNGTLAGRYRRSASSDLIYLEVRMTAGGTTTFGSGFYSFSLPVNASANAILFTSGSGNLYDSSALTRYGCAAKVDSATTVILNAHSGTIAATVPFTWASGDALQFTMWYEPAS